MLSPGWRQEYYWGLMIARALLTYLIFIDVAYNAKLLNLSDAFKQQQQQYQENQSPLKNHHQFSSSSRRSIRSSLSSNILLAINDNNTNTNNNDETHRDYLINDQPINNLDQFGSQCCACDEAKYELVFEGLWSRYTHPDDFPENYWLAQFSDIIGASHSNEFRMWDQDTLATEGVRELAETGSTKKLEAELKQVSSKTRTIIKARELRYPLLNGKTSAVFRTDRQHHLVSILSKLNPSPDWILGISGLELCQSDCSWATQRVVNLYLWDAGTDSGITFTAPDLPTRPQERIHPYRKVMMNMGQSQRKSALNQLSSKQEVMDQQQQVDQQMMASSPQSEQTNGQQYLADSSIVNPSYSSNNGDPSHSSSSSSRPYARLTITRQRIYEKSCNNNHNNNNNNNNSSSNSNYDSISAPVRRPPIHSSSQSAVSNVVNPIEWAETTMSNLVDCRYTDWSDWSICSSNCGKGIRTRTRGFVDESAQQGGCSQMNLIEKEICLSECVGNVTCITRDWSEWSKCSVTCGQGIRKRTRSPIGQMRKQCGRIELSQSEVCIASHNVDCPQPGGESNGCEVTEWSQWSKCSVACGKGTRIRTRQYLRKDGSEMSYCNNTLIQKTSCTGRLESCSSSSSDSRNNNNNNNSRPNQANTRHTTNHNHQPQTKNYPLSQQYTCLKPVDSGPCKASIQRWHFNASLNLCSRFSYGGCLGNANNFETFQDCERNCLLLLSQSQFRTDQHHQQQQQQHQSNKPHNPNLPVIDCKLSSWSPWSTCSALCGNEGKRTRSRYIIQMPQNGGKPCDKKLSRTQKCKDLPPCPPNYLLLTSSSSSS